MNFNWCDPSSVKQIAGRAGRLSSNYKHGVVTAWQVRMTLHDKHIAPNSREFLLDALISRNAS